MTEIMPLSEKILTSWAHAQNYAVGERVYRQEMADRITSEIAIARGRRPVGFEDIMDRTFPAFRRRIIFPIGMLEYSLHEAREGLVAATCERVDELVQRGEYGIILTAHLGGRLQDWNSEKLTDKQISDNSQQVFSVIIYADNIPPDLIDEEGKVPQIDLSGDTRIMLSHIIDYIEEGIRRKENEKS